MFSTIQAWARPGAEPGVTDYTEVDTMDLKGNFPPRLMNMMIASEVQKEFKSMYKNIKLD